MKAVLDTNVFISGIHWTGPSEKVLQKWMDNKFELVSSLPIIEELVKVLINFKVPMEPDAISWWEFSFRKINIGNPNRRIQCCP